MLRHTRVMGVKGTATAAAAASSAAREGRGDRWAPPAWGGEAWVSEVRCRALNALRCTSSFCSSSDTGGREAG